MTGRRRGGAPPPGHPRHHCTTLLILYFDIIPSTKSHAPEFLLEPKFVESSDKFSENEKRHIYQAKRRNQPIYHPSISSIPQIDARLKQILGQSFVKVQNIVYQSAIADKQRLLQILEQISVKVWDKSKKPIDKEVLSRFTIEMIEFLRNNPSTVKQLLEFLNYANSPEFRRKILNPMIELGYIAMTNPDKPTSSKQQYLLTDKALELF